MSKTDIYPMKRGNVLVSVNGFFGDDDFYLMHKVICELLTPDDEGYSVDSMCIGGYFKKDGLLIKTSSECPFDTCCFFYDEASLDESAKAKVNTWIDRVVDEMIKRKGENR